MTSIGSFARTSHTPDYASQTRRRSPPRPTTPPRSVDTVGRVMNALRKPTLTFRLSPRVRRTVLTVHIVASVGLLGDVAAVLAVNLRAAATSDPAFATTSYELLSMFSLVFGIPLSFISLISGIVLGLGSKWGVLRYPWVTAKLVLIVTVLLVGALVIGPTTEAMIDDRSGSETVLILASAYDVLALTLATGLAVFKPGRARQSRRLQTETA
jgi:hypothetical protein